MPKDVNAESALVEGVSPPSVEGLYERIRSYLAAPAPDQSDDHSRDVVAMLLARWYANELNVAHLLPAENRLKNPLYKGFVDLMPVIPDLDVRIAKIVVDNPSSLDMGKWHTCQTTHCIAGWAIHLLGDPELESLEFLCSPGLLAMALFDAAGIWVPDFYTTDRRGLSELRARLEFGEVWGALQGPEIFEGD